MQKLLLIDGHNLLFRMFFGVPSKIYGKDNKPIHGVVGFVGALIKMTALFEPTHLIVVFDSEKDSFRFDIDPDYKGNRLRDWTGVADEENPFSQIENIYKSLDYMSIPYCEVEGVEADDIIAGYARKYKKEANITIVSTDSDLLQLIDSNVRVFCPRGKKSILYTPIEVKEKFGVGPEMVSELKALVGDKTDNIKGIYGIGEKTAVKLINEFGSIGEIYNRISDIVPAKLREKLVCGENQVKKNLKLVGLDKKIKLPFKFSDLRIVNNIQKFKTMKVIKEIKLID